jgi:hypothetical protein
MVITLAVIMRTGAVACLLAWFPWFSCGLGTYLASCKYTASQVVGEKNIPYLPKFERWCSSLGET